MDQDEDPTLYRPEQTVAILSIVPAAILPDEPVLVEERTDCVGEIEAAMCKTVIALGFVPFEIHGDYVGQ